MIEEKEKLAFRLSRGESYFICFWTCALQDDGQGIGTEMFMVRQLKFAMEVSSGKRFGGYWITKLEGTWLLRRSVE